MIGAREIVAMRRQGWKPSGVFVCDWRPAGKPAIEEGVVYVAGSNPDTSDTRFAVGTIVHLLCDDENRAIRWADRLLLDGARMVIHASNGEVMVWRN